MCRLEQRCARRWSGVSKRTRWRQFYGEKRGPDEDGVKGLLVRLGAHSEMMMDTGRNPSWL